MYRSRFGLKYVLKVFDVFVNVHPGAGRLFTGSSISQILLFALYPVLARQYGPLGYGEFGTFVAFSSVISVIVAGTYETAIPIADTDESAVNLIMVSLIIVIVVSFLTFSVGHWAGPYLFKSNLFDSIQRIYWLLSISLIFSGVSHVLQNWLMRFKEYSLISVSSILQIVAQGFLQLGFGLTGASAIHGLAFGFVGGQMVYCLYLSVVFLKKYGCMLKNISLAKMWYAARRNRKFPFYTLPSVLLNNFVLELPIFILNHYGLRVVGWFTMAQRLLIQPLNFLGFAISNTYYVESAKRMEQGIEEIRKLFWYTTQKISFSGLFMFGFLTANAYWIFRFVFGPQWTESAIYVYILAIPYFLMFVSGTVSNTSLVVGRQDFLLYREIIRAVLFGLLMLSSMYIPLTGKQMVILLAVFSTVIYGVHFGVSWLSLRMSMMQME